MNTKKTVFRTVIIFTCIMGVLMLGYLLLQAFADKNSQVTINTDTMELVQLDEPKEGDPTAVVDTTLGEFRFVLYPQYAPNSVNNFIELAEKGYYDNTYVFHSEGGAYSGIGSPNKDGTLPDGYDKSAELVERELHQNLWPLKGAVCAMNTTVDRSFFQSIFGGGTYYCGSRLAVINSIEFTDEIKSDILSTAASEELSNAFIEKGGIPNFSQQMTIIGQTYEGLDVVEALASLETNDSDSYKIPKEDVMINSVKISTYSKKEQSEKND